MKKVILLLLLISPIIANAQFFDVFDLDTSEYPIMKAKFYSIDANGKQILNHTPADFEITENGEPRDVLSVSCPDPLPIPISVGIMVDTYKYIALTRHGSERLVNLLNMPLNEIAITYMNQSPLLYQDFTKNKQKGVESTRTIPEAPGGTKVSEMFFDDFAGGINFIKNREIQNRVLIFISDLHCPNLNLDEQKLFNEALSNNIRIFTILLNTDDNTGLFGRMADETNGILYEYIKDSIEIEDIFEEIAYKVQNRPCDIKWVNKINCEKINNLEIVNKRNYKFVKKNINLSNNQRFNLELSPYFINFGQLNIDETKDTTIIIKANNKEQTIKNIIFEPELYYFEVINTLPLTIRKDESIELKIKYKSLDNLKQYVKMILTTELCDYNGGLTVGSENQSIANRTLKLIHPNGGEVLNAGSDTIITWKGISEQEKVKLRFSSNSGNQWSLISNSASNFVYNWSIPRIQSDSCLVVIDQYENTNDMEYKDGEMEWGLIFGGSRNEEANAIIQTKDGGYIFVGNSSSNDFKITNIGNQGYNDILILKIQSDGNIEWVKTYGGSNEDKAKSVRQTIDGGYIVVGYSASKDGDLTNDGNKGGEDFWVMKLLDTGEIEWSRTYGGSNFERPSSIIETRDAGYVLTGFSTSSDGELIELENKGQTDAWVLKLKNDGEIVWSKTFGGDRQDELNSITETVEGGFIVAGYSSSYDNGNESIWLM